MSTYSPRSPSFKLDAQSTTSDTVYSPYSPQTPSFKRDARSDISTGDTGTVVHYNLRRNSQPTYYRKDYSADQQTQLPTLPDVEIASLRRQEQVSKEVSDSRSDSGDGETGYGRSALLRPFLITYRALSGMLGFKERFSLMFFFVCGGGLLGFCLARAFMMSERIRRAQTPPGDYRWFDLKLYNINYILHIYATIIGGILVGLQFLPAIRRNFVWLHRINGYLCIILLIPGNVAGAIVARRSFGGEINQQSAYYLLTIMLVLSMLMGLYNVKRNTRAHRKWMLRSVVYFSVVVLARVISVISRAIVINFNLPYYTVWRCDEVLYVLQDANTLSQMYPQCVQNVSDITNNPLSVAVPASDDLGKLGRSSALRLVAGMCLWISALVHVVGVEIYLMKTESENYNRHGYVLEPRRGVDTEDDANDRF